MQGNDLRRKVDLWRFIAYRNAYGGREDVYTFPVYTFFYFCVHYSFTLKILSIAFLSLILFLYSVFLGSGWDWIQLSTMS